MAWPLFEAVLLCLGRRARAFCRQAPVPATVVALVLVLAPVALARATSAVARSSAAALADPAATRIVALALLGPALAAGAASSRLVPPADRLGAAIVIAPVRRRVVALAAALPTILAGAAFLPLAASVAVPFALAAPGGLPAAGALGAALVATVSAGAAAAQLVSVARRGVPQALSIAVALAAVPVLAALGVGDPTSRVADVLAGRAGAGRLTLEAAALLAVATAAWAISLRGHVRGSVSRRRRWHALPVRPLPVLSLSLAVLLRRSETRGAVAAGALLGLGAAAAGRAVGLEADAAALLGLTSVLAAGAVAPLAVGGAVVELRWVLAAGPIARGRTAAAWLAATVVVSALSVVPLAFLALVEGALTAGTVATFGLGVLLSAGCGVLAGSIAPWRPGAVGDQTLTLGLLAVVAAGAGALALGGAWVGGRIAIEERWTALAVAAVPLASAAVLLTRRLERG